MGLLGVFSDSKKKPKVATETLHIINNFPDIKLSKGICFIQKNIPYCKKRKKIKHYIFNNDLTMVMLTFPLKIELKRFVS